MKYEYQRTFTSEGKQFSTANQIIVFEQKDPVDGDILKFSTSYLSFETFDKDLRIRFNNEQTTHTLFANKEYIFKDFLISRITILDAGVEFYYTAFIPNP